MLKRLLLLFALVPAVALVLPLNAFAGRTGVETPALSTPASQAAAAAAKSSDILTAKDLKALIASAKTPADHVKLQKHYLALAAKYDAEATDHAAEAAAYRKNPTFMESKNPVGPNTAAHCDRFAERAREDAKEARELASAHEHMAEAVN